MLKQWLLNFFIEVTPNKLLFKFPIDIHYRFNVERLVENTMGTIKNVDSRLNEQISYLTQVSNIQPHEGSAYSSQIGKYI